MFFQGPPPFGAPLPTFNAPSTSNPTTTSAKATSALDTGYSTLQRPAANPTIPPRPAISLPARASTPLPATTTPRRRGRAGKSKPSGQSPPLPLTQPSPPSAPKAMRDAAAAQRKILPAVGFHARQRRGPRGNAPAKTAGNSNNKRASHARCQSGKKADLCALCRITRREVDGGKGMGNQMRGHLRQMERDEDVQQLTAALEQGMAMEPDFGMGDLTTAMARGWTMAEGAEESLMDLD